MKLILENWQNFVSEQLLEEAPENTLSNWFTTTMNKVSDDDPEAKLAKAEELMGLLGDAIKSKDFSKIVPAWQGDEKVPKVMPGAEKYYKALTQGKSPRSLMVKIRAAASTAKDAREKLELAAAAAKKAAEEKKITDEKAQKALAQQAVKAADPKLANNPKATEAVLQAMSPPAEDNLESVKNKYQKQVSAIVDDPNQQVVIYKFLKFLSDQGILKESVARLAKKSGLDTKKITDFLSSLTGDEQKLFKSVVNNKEVREKIVSIVAPKKPTPEDFDAAMDKAAENAIKSQNPEQQINQDAKTIANIMGKPEAADKVGKAIEDRVGDSPGGQTDNPDKVDPEPDDLVELKKTYLAFRDKFYCPIDKDANRRQRREARLRCSKEGIAISKNDQHNKITDLITALEDIIEKEEGEAGYDSSKQQLQEQSSRPIVALKADLTMFLKQARGAQNIINKAQELAGTKAGKYHLKKAIERAKNVLELTGGLYDDLRRISKGLGQRTKQTPPKSDLNEAAQEVEKAYNLVLSNIEDVIGDIGDDLPQSEFLPRMKKSLEGLESILKYFPKGRLGGKGSSGSGEIYTKYKEALSQFGNDFSILKNLPDELSDKDAGSTSLNVAAQQIRAFANDLVEIFGLQMPTSFNKKVEQGPPVEVPGTPDTEQPKEDPEQVIQDLAVDLEAAAEAAIQKATEELPDGSPEEIAKRAGEILAADKAAEEELRKQAETEAAAKEALEQAKKEELKKQEELAVQNAMDGDEEEDKSISFTTEREMIKFFNFTLFKDPTIRGELERLNMDDKDFSNLKKVMAYLLSSTAEFMNENLKTMHLVSQGISTKPKKALKVLFTKEKELYKWFKEWIVDNTVQKKKLFIKIGEFLKKKNYNFNLEGLTIQRLQGLNFSAAPTDIPPKEEDAIKKTVEKVKNKLKDRYPDQDELMANVEQDVISVIQNPKNSEIFNWSTGQSSSELSSMVGDFVLNPKETTPKKKTKKRNWGKTQAQMRQDTAERGQVPVEEKLTRLLESFIKQQLRGK